MSTRIYDLIGIGLGPFNLGLAALSEPLEGVDSLFIDQAAGFDWHPGMMLEGATMQTSFIADLVTLADPTSPYSFLSYAKAMGRLYAFYIKEDFFLLRKEYNLYCQWVANQLSNLRFNERVSEVTYLEEQRLYRVATVSACGKERGYLCRKLVLGTGTQPVLPACCKDVSVLHSSQYLQHRDRLRAMKHVTLIGSGQSAAEIYFDLLKHAADSGNRVDWITRSERFFPLEYTKLTLEMTSPDYVDYFHALPMAERDKLLQQQRCLYKGINRSQINQIYDELYRQGLEGEVPSQLVTNTSLVAVSAQGQGYRLSLKHNESGESWQQLTQGLVIASGYGYQEPGFLKPLQHRLLRDAAGRLAVARNYSIDKDQHIYVQNAELHTHGLAAPDLTMACYRNSIILREILGYAPYPVEEKIAFQTFGPSPECAPSVSHSQLQPFPAAVQEKLWA